MISESYLYRIETSLATKQGRPPCQVVISLLPREYHSILSIFNKDEQMIIFNADMISRSSEMTIIASLIHESRHAHQWYQIHHPEQSNEDDTTLKRWLKEFELYFQPLKRIDSAHYLNQEIEIDAIAYTSQFMEKSGDFKLDIPENIQEKVKARQDLLNIRENL